MSFVIGFGSTEKSFEDKLERYITDWIYEAYSSSNHNYFTDDFAHAVHKHIDSMAIQSRMAAEEYKIAAEYPSRYSSFYHTVLHDCNYMAVIFRFSHINRRHAMSPDGWAMIKTQRVLVVDEWAAGRKKRSA